MTPIAPAKGSATTVMVPIGGCTVVGNGFAFDETLSIAETPVVGENVTAIGLPSGNPTSVQVLETGSGTPPAYFTSCPTPPGSDATVTNEAVLTNTVTMPFTPTTTASTLTDVTISECNTTEVDVTNTDPPSTTQPPATPQPPTSGGGGGGSSSGGGSSGGSSSGGGAGSGSDTPSSTGSSTTPATGLTGTPTGLAANVGVTDNTTSTTAAALKLAAEKSELSTIEATLTELQHTWNLAASANNALARQIAYGKATLASLEHKQALAKAASLQKLLAKQTAQARANLNTLELKYAKAVSANQALAKEIAATKTSQARLIAEVAVLEK